MRVHPPFDRLGAEVLSGAEAEHLDGCARCRVDRRLLLASLVDAEVPGLSVAREALEHARAGMVSSAGFSEVLSSFPAPRATRDVGLGSGEAVGGYVVDGLLGTGGMAVVYRVVHAKLRSLHALKLLAAPGHELRTRLLREGRVQGRLRHPNIVSVTDVVEHEGSPALVLEYVPGPTLDQARRAVDLSLDEVDALAIDVIAGVAAAHQQGFIHRDLKPSNVLLDPSGPDLVAKVADFGLAKAVGSEPVDHLRTQTGGMLGTLLYMSPEQLRDPRLADARSDVFALGALLYELVSDRRCFAGVDAVDIMGRITSGERRPLPANLPQRMVEAIDAALSVDPAERPDSAAAVLDLWTAGRTVQRPTWASERVSRIGALHRMTELPPSPPAPPIGRRRQLWPWLLGSAGGVAALAVGAGWLAFPASSELAVMVVHEIPGAPGRNGGTQLVAVAADDLEGVFTPSCVSSGSACAAEEPGSDAWVPLVQAPAGPFERPWERVGFAGVEARIEGEVYQGLGEGFAPGERPTLELDGLEIPVSMRLPTAPELLVDATRPLMPAHDEAVEIRWRPGGGGVPFIEVRPRQGGGRLYHLADDGVFTLPAEVFPPAPSQTDVVFGRTARERVDVRGRSVSVLARTQQVLTVVRVDEERAYLSGLAPCEETKIRPPLAPGHYWMLMDGEAVGQPMKWDCWARPNAGFMPVYPVVVGPGERVAVRVATPEGDPLLWVAKHPFCLPQNCLASPDRSGSSEVVVLDAPGESASTFNVGIVDADGVGGLVLIDVVELAPPEAQTAELLWVEATEADGPDRAELRITAAADLEYRLGLAETESPDGWYGEDCLHGSTMGDVHVCHEFVGEVGGLTRVADGHRVRSGETTLFWPDIGRGLTVYLEARNTLRPDGRPWCWVWGPRPEYYAQRGCEVFSSLEPPVPGR